MAVKIVPVRLISSSEKEFAHAFQELIQMTNNVFSGNKGRGASMEDYKKLKRDIKRYHNYPFAQTLFDRIQEWDKELIDVINSKRGVAKKSEMLRQNSAKLLQLFSSGNIPAAYSQAQQMKSLIASLDKTQIDPKKVISNKRNPFYIENPLFFGRNGFLNQFEKDDMDNIIRKNLDEYCWTYMPLPDNRATDYEYIAYWIMNLQKNSDPVELSAHSFSKYAEFAYSTEQFDVLKKMVENYLRGNQKQLIPKILQILEKIPDLKATNDDRKNQITTVYRGIPNVEDINQVMAEEKNAQFVATSTYKGAAERFAMKIGHLESKSSRRSETGMILTYSVTPNDIILDTTIFGGVFNEDEVLINSRTAKLESYEDLDDMEDEDNRYENEDGPDWGNEGDYE